METRRTDDGLTLPNEVSVDVQVETATDRQGDDPRVKSRERNKPILERMRKQFRTIVEATHFFREQAVDDALFRLGKWGSVSYQWVATIQAEREADARPCLTINRAPGFVRQVTNQQRQANLRIRVVPVDDQADPRLAETIQGLIRNVESNSFASRAYNMGGDKQAEQGLGYIGLKVEWATDDPDNVKDLFRQRAKITRVRDPLSVFTDPSAEEMDFGDAEFQFKVTDVDVEQWKVITGRDDPPSPEGFESWVGGTGDVTGEWFPNGKIRMVMYANREPRGPKKLMAILSDGAVIHLSNPATQRAELAALGITIKRERWVQKRVMVLRVCDGLDIHEETEWAGDRVPYTPVIGDEAVNPDTGELDWRGVIRDAKDPARVYNVEVSALTEEVGRGQKAPVLGVEGQFGKEGSALRRAWETANRKPRAFLEYVGMSIDGKPAPRPDPLHITPNIEGIVVAIHQADEDYKTTAGYHDASLGERGPQESGKAINARQRQDELGNSHYLDNERYAIASVGKQLIKVLRVILDQPTVARITGNDERQRKVMVFSGAENDPRRPAALQTHMGMEPMPLPDGSVVQPGQKIPFQLPKGVTEIWDLSVGEFDVEVSAGPDPGSRRQEETEVLLGVFKLLPPELAMKFIDLLFGVIDTPIGRQLMERAKKVLPGDMQDDEAGDPMPPRAKAMIQQVTQQRDQLMALAKAMKQEIDVERGKLRSQLLLKREERQSAERIAMLKERSAMLQQKADINAERALVLLEAEIRNLEATREAEDAATLAQLDAEQAQRDRQHEADLAILDHTMTLATAPPQEPSTGGQDGQA